MRSTLHFFRKFFFHWRDLDLDKPLRGIKNINWRIAFEIAAYHLGAICVIFVGINWTTCISFLLAGLLQGLCVTVLLHRYFTHRAFDTTRTTQCIFGLLALIPLQRGPIWWASHHRRHHHLADKVGDPYSPSKGFFYSHLGWLLTLDYAATDTMYVKDLIKYKELLLIDRFEWLAPITLLTLTFLYGSLLDHYFPSLKTNGWQMLVWVFCMPTVCVLHGSCLVNSVLHRFGYRRFATKDDAKNVWQLAFFTFGEAFHNNHHRYSESCRQGITWWEIDISYYAIKILEKLGIIFNLRTFPTSVIAEGTAKSSPHWEKEPIPCPQSQRLNQAQKPKMVSENPPATPPSKPFE